MRGLTLWSWAAVSKPRSAWLAYVVVLAAYPLLPVVTASSMSSAPRLPVTVRGLLALVLVEAVVFIAFFGPAWLAARPSAASLRLAWRGGAAPLGLGLGYGLLLFAGLVVCGWAASAVPQLDALRPQVERLVDPGVLGRDRVYLLVATTVVSFGLAGFREELWRSAVLTGISELFPNGFGHPAVRAAAVLATSVLFGIGHVTQGVGGVVLTALLGVAFGAILLSRRSIWEAVLAHGVFDASSFLLLAFGAGAP
jgi:membrane protease YdiL (CAAX protease family)